MKRTNLVPREDYAAVNASFGFDYDEDGYWCEDAVYEITMEEANNIERATDILYGLTVDFLSDITDEELESYGLNDELTQRMVRSIEEDDYTLYGRMDLAVDGKAIKLLEFNADTPTQLLEAAVIQWQRFGGQERQWCEMHERLIKTFKERWEGWTIHFTYSDTSREDYRTAEYLADLARQAGCAVMLLPIHTIGSDGQELYDVAHHKIEHLFKLYPYEWLFQEPFAPVLPKTKCQIIEPFWKYLLSDKLSLVHLWNRNKGHPLLLRTELVDFGGDIVRKPMRGREGRGVEIRLGESKHGTRDEFYNGPVVYQEYVPLPVFGDQHLQVGSWIVNGEPAGIGLREGGRIIGNWSHFVPHVLR